MIYFLILGFIFLVVYGLFFLYWPTRQGLTAQVGKQTIYTFPAEFGFIFFMFSIISFIIGLLLYKRSKKNDELSLFVSINLVISWFIFVISQLTNNIVLLLRPDIIKKSYPQLIGFVIPTYKINLNLFGMDITSPPIQYVHLLLFVGLFGILLFYKSFGSLIIKIKSLLAEGNKRFLIEYKVAFFLSFAIYSVVFLFMFIYTLANVYFLNGQGVKLIMDQYNNILKLLDPLTKALNISKFTSPVSHIGLYKDVDLILLLIIATIISSIIFTSIMLSIIKTSRWNVDKSKLNIRRNTVSLGILVIFVLGIFIDVAYLFWFSPIPPNQSFFWRFRELLTSALFTAMIYLEISLGITLVYKILKFANFSHAELVTFGAYVAFIVGVVGDSIGTWQLFNFLGIFEWIPVFLILATFSFVMTALLAWALDIIVFKPLRQKNASPITLMVASFALGLSLRMIFQSLFSARPVAVSQYFVAVNLDSTILRIVVIASVLFSTWFFQIILYNTKYGKIMRAVSDNEDLAKVSGIKVSRIHLLVWIIAGGFAGVAGLLFVSYPVGTPWINPQIGFILLLSAFAVAILGGIGSFEGVVLASLIVGFTENMGVVVLNQLSNLNLRVDIPTIGFSKGLPFITNFVANFTFSTSYKIALSYIILIIVLKIRPYGLLGEKPSGDR